MTKNGTFRLATLAHRDPQQRDILQQAAVVIAPDELSNVHPMTRVHRTREAMLLVDLASNKKRIQAARDYIAAHRTLGGHSVMIVPLPVHGQTLGVMTLGRAGDRGIFTPDDLELAEELARRTALAVANARLYSDAQDANRLKDEFLATVSHNCAHH